MRTLTIDLVTDIVCPWCFIGSRRLDEALASLPDVEATVRHVPFLLDPSAPTGGGDLRERLRAKYRTDPERMFKNVEAQARSSGIPLDFAKVTRWCSTVEAHTLLRHAEAKGTQRALVGALYNAYFLEGRDVGDPEVLADIASAHGFKRDEAPSLVRDAQGLAVTRKEAASVAAQGIQGVPFFIFGEQFAASGAQPAEVIRGAIEKALDEG